MKKSYPFKFSAFTALAFASMTSVALTASVAGAQVIKPQPPRPTPIAPPMAGIKPAKQFSLMGGAALDSGQEPNGNAYEHQTWNSPVVRVAFHHAFFSQRTLQMLVGGQYIYSRSLSQASGNGRFADFTTTRSDLAASIGMGFAPGRGPFMFQGLLSVGTNLSNKRELKSAGFTAEIDNSWSDNAFPLILVLDALASYDLDENWRLIGGFNIVSDSTSSFLFGGAYAF